MLTSTVTFIPSASCSSLIGTPTLPMRKRVEQANIPWAPQWKRFLLGGTLGTQRLKPMKKRFDLLIVSLTNETNPTKLSVLRRYKPQNTLKIQGKTESIVSIKWILRLLRSIVIHANDFLDWRNIAQAPSVDERSNLWVYDNFIHRFLYIYDTHMWTYLQR